MAGRTRKSKTRASPGNRVRELEDELRDLRQQLERSERRVEAMKQIGRALGSSLELDPLLGEIVRRTTELLEADRSTLFLVDAERKELWSKVLEGNELREIRMPQGIGIAGWVASHKRPVHIKDAYFDERFNPEFDRRSGYRTRNVLAWPVLRGQGEAIGVIQVLNKNVGGFSADDERLLEAIASEIGVALEVSRLYREALERSEALERARGELMLLFETERAISQASDLGGMLESILGNALRTLSAAAGVIHLLDERGVALEVQALAGALGGAKQTRAERLRLRRELAVDLGSTSKPSKTRPAEAGRAAVASVLRTSAPVLLNRQTGITRGGARVRSIVAVPIQTKEAGTIGVFELLNKRGQDGFTDEDLRTLGLVAAQAGRAIAAEQRRKERERSERLTTIGQMLSGIMHDLRTPMTLISGYSQMAAMSTRKSEREQYARLVQKQVEALGAMTKDLLAFARGDRSILIRKVYVQHFMGEMQEYLEKDLEGSGVDLAIKVAYRGAARFDETKMRRVFHNIARNAREAMPGGGRFEVSVRAEGGELVIDFADTGSGIPPELEGKVFEPFSTAGKVGGTGLGLAMVKQIAEEHRGRVSYESTPGRGTRFTLRIPLAL